MNTVALKLPTPDAGGEASLILVETSGGDLPRLAGAGDIKKAAVEFQKQLQPVIAFAGTVLDALQAAKPGKVEIEFGIELSGEVGIPLVTSGSTKANLKVKLTWASKAGGKDDEE